MASSPAAPSTPTIAGAPRRTALNRSFTVPAKINPASSPKTSAEIGAADGIETLYTHPSANIIKFTTTSSRPTSSNSPGRPQSSSGTEPWTSLTERTLAAGPMEIYRVPGSVSFLRSGTLLHAILPRSQCWCVDGVSKFALRVLPETYYRIELPGANEEDLQEVEKLKETLRKVLFFERTPCPFSRGFTVDLPEEPELKKKRRKSAGPAKKWRLERGYSWKPEGWVAPEEGAEDSASESSVVSDEDNDSDASARESEERVGQAKQVNNATQSRPKVTAGFRSVTAPSYVLPQSSPSSKLRTSINAEGVVEVNDGIPSNNDTNVTRTLQAIPTSMPPSPPESSAGADYADPQIQSETGATDSPALASSPAPLLATGGDVTPAENSIHDTSKSGEEPEDAIAPVLNCSKPEDEAQVTGDTPVETHSERDLASQGQAERQPTLPDDRPVTPEAQKAPDDPYAAIQARILARRSIGGTTAFYPGHKSPTRESTSSNSSSATLSSNKTSVSRRSQSSHSQQAFATAMVKKACAAFIGPPARLVAIMLQIAARYADAAFGMNSMFYVESPNDSPKRVPGSYYLDGDLDDDDDDDVRDLEPDSEDDFGVPLRSPVRLATFVAIGDIRGRRRWDVD